MFFFKKKPVLLDVKTQSMPLLKSLWNGVFPCRHCRGMIGFDKHKPLSEVTCPHCRRASLVPSQFAKYWIYKFLGEGGMGRVYKAVSEEYPDEVFAIKFLPEGMENDEKLIEALHVEAQMSQFFAEHPNTISPVELGVSGGRYFLVTVFIDGERLDHRVLRLGYLQEREMLSLALEILQFEQYAYKKGYLYRDLKPENIMIHTDTLVPIIMDFGLCCSLAEARERTTEEFFDGSPHFMPPERLTGEGEGVHSEIYSLGMLLYFTITGGTFYEGGYDVQKVAEMYAFRDEKEDILQMILHISDDVKKIIQRMIQRDPVDRYHTFERVMNDISAYLNR